MGVDLAVFQLKCHVVKERSVDPLAQSVQLRMRGLDQGLDVTTVPQVNPKPESALPGLQAQVGVPLLGGVATGVKEALSLFLPLTLQS